MSPGAELFLKGLRDMGYDPKPGPKESWVIDYKIDVGTRAGTMIRMGFQKPQIETFPQNPPGGPHISPRILPINTNANAHPHRVHASDEMGPDWEYWSRPFEHWAKDNRSVGAYMAHIRRLFTDL